MANCYAARGAKLALTGALVVLVGAAGVAAQEPAAVAAARPDPIVAPQPVALRMKRAASTTLDLRLLPQAAPEKVERPEREPPEVTPVALPGGPPAPSAAAVPGRNAPAPATLLSFDGLDFANWGAGHPPDTNGDVGPAYYIETVNSSIGVYRKSDQVRVAAFTFNSFMSQGSFGNLCDTNNFGDPVVLYDTFEDRWVITDFAFFLDGSGNVVNPPGSFQCFAVSKTGDPVSGGWNFYSINTAGGLGDYPKFGIWPDGLYMSTNMFDYSARGSFQNPRVYAFNKAQMYAGSPTIQVVSFNAPATEFTLLPANARLQTGTPPPGSPNYYAVVWQFTNAVSVYKFHVDWNSISTSTFTGPFIALAPASWAIPPASVPSQGGNNLDTLAVRLMMQNQYTNLGGVESLWDSHTVRGSSATQSAVRYYQTAVTGGTVAANTTQAATHNPDTTNRFMPSVAVDRAGDLALGYSTTSGVQLPAIKYAGNLSTDPLNAITQTEVSLINGTGTQTGTCGSSACIRWGDYSAMTLDPDGCTFWYANEYYAVSGLNDLTRIGSFAFPSCTPVGSGTVQGTVTATAGGAPIGGASVALGSRTATTAGNGTYSFTGIPAGTYPGMKASAPGYVSSAVAGIVVAGGGTATADFSLATAPASACPTDTTQADFQTGVPANVDLDTSPGDVILPEVPTVDQQNTSVTINGFGFTSTFWAGQTFTAGVTGQLTRVDLDLFCSGCTGTTPSITVSIRATTGSPAVPAGADLATATIAGFKSGSGGYFTASFGAPPTLTAGTRYAIVLRAAADPSAGTYAYVCSCLTDTNPYANGQRIISADSGATWAADVTSGGRDLGFKVFVTELAPSGDLISSVKDSNPATGNTPTWTTLSWTASTPGNTSLKFQAAAANSATGPFNFVGPDGTAATFFTASGASLAQFHGKRYLEYRAYLATTDGTTTPTLDDVTACFTDLPSADLAITNTDGVTTAIPGGSVTYTIVASNLGPSGAPGASVTDTFPTSLTCSWHCAGAGSGTCTASGSGNISDTVNLPVGASVTYTAVCAIAGSATGTLSNTASVGVPAGVADPNSANSSATDSDSLLTGLFYTITPCRLADTRNPIGPYGGPALNAASVRTFVAAGQCGVPAGALAIAYNLTVTQGTQPGDLRIYPTGIPAPLVSTINYGGGQTRANNGISLLGGAGDFVILSDQPAGTVQVIVDLNGYFK